jgi:WD40 repeat protein
VGSRRGGEETAMFRSLSMQWAQGQCERVQSDALGDKLQSRWLGRTGIVSFDAFVSYSHAADGRLAPALQRAMQRLAKPWYRVHALRVFRDESALSANPHLWASIESALDQSEWFVLMASPEAVSSEWVDRELRYWLATKPATRILVVVTDGTWRWDPAANGLTGTAVSEALREAFDEEPRHVDLRWARTTTDLDLRNGRFRDAVAQLAAPAHGIGKDELDSEDVRLHRRARRLARGATSLLVVLVVLSLILGTVAWQQRSQAQHQAAHARADAALARRETNAALARDLASQSQDALRAGHLDAALLLATAAYKREVNDATRASLLSALTDRPALVKELHGLTSATAAVAFSPNGKLIAAETLDGATRIWNVASGQLLQHQPVAPSSSYGGPLAFADDGRLLVSSVSSVSGSDYGLQVVSVDSGRLIRRLRLSSTRWAAGAHSSLAVVSTGSAACAFDCRTQTELSVVNLRTGTRGVSIRVDGDPALSDDGSRIGTITNQDDAQTRADIVRAWSTTTGQPIGPGCHAPLGVPHTNTLDDLREAFDFTIADHTSLLQYGTGPVPEALNGPGTLVTCDPNTGATTTRELRDDKGYVSAVTKDGHTYATRVINDGTITLRSTSNGTPTNGPFQASWYQGKLAPVNTVVFSPDGRYVTATQNDGTVFLWQTRPEPPLGRTASTSPALQIGAPQDPSGRVYLTFAELSSGPNEPITIHDTTTRRTIATIDGSAYGARFSADGHRLAVPTSAGISVLQLPGGRRQEIAARDIGCADPGVSLSANGTTAAATCASVDPAYRFDLRLIDLSTRPYRIGPNTTEPNAGFTNMALSPNGNIVAGYGESMADGSLQIFVRDGLRLHPHQPHQESGGATVTWAPDSKTLIWGRGDGRITLVRPTPAGEVLTDLAPPGGGYEVAAFSPDGKYLAVARLGQARLWDATTLVPLGALKDIPLDVLSGRLDASDCCYVSLRFSRDSLSLTAEYAGRNSTRADRSTTWYLDPRVWIKQACSIANRNLAAAEWIRYAGSTPAEPVCPISSNSG